MASLDDFNTDFSDTRYNEYSRVLDFMTRYDEDEEDEPQGVSLFGRATEAAVLQPHNDEYRIALDREIQFITDEGVDDFWEAYDLALQVMLDSGWKAVRQCRTINFVKGNCACTA